MINLSFFISVKMCSVSPVDELHALGQTLVKINMFIQKKKKKKCLYKVPCLRNRKHTSLLISWEYPESAITASIFELQSNHETHYLAGGVYKIYRAAKFR